MIRQSSVRAGAVLAAAALAVAGVAAPAIGSEVSGATLVVRAVDAATGAPVSGFCAQVSPIDANACGDGAELTFEDLAAGSASVFVSAGETTNYLPSADIPVTLVEGGTATVSVPLTMGGRLSATVVDRATGQPVADACLAPAVPGRGTWLDCRFSTDEQGRVTSPALPVGTYQMFVVAPEGYGHQWVGPRGGTGDQRAAARIRIRADRVTSAPAVLLDRPGTVSGVVRDPAGAPVSGARVSTTAWNFGYGPTPDTVRTDEQGRYTMDRLGPYSWPLIFSSGGDLPRQWSRGVANRFRAETISVRAGADTTYDMDLVRGSVLRGAVTVRGGAVSDGWRITAVNAATGDEIGVADSDGAGDPAYEMPLVGPQQVKIRWDVQAGGEDRTGWWEDAADITTADRVPVPRSGTRTLDLTV